MYEGDFSQAPIQRDGKLVALLTAETIARWMAARFRGEAEIILESEPVAEVLKFTEPTTKYEIVGRNTPVVEAIAAFEEHYEKGESLESEPKPAPPLMQRTDQHRQSKSDSAKKQESSTTTSGKTGHQDGDRTALTEPALTADSQEAKPAAPTSTGDSQKALIEAKSSENQDGKDVSVQTKDNELAGSSFGAGET